MTRPLPKIIRLTRRGRAKTSAEIRQARIEADTESAVSALLETQSEQHRAAVLKAAHRVAVRELAKIGGAEATATLLNVEAGRLWPPLQMSRRAVAESELAKILRSGGFGG